MSTASTMTVLRRRGPAAEPWRQRAVRLVRPVAVSVAAIAVGLLGVALPQPAVADISIAKPVEQLFASNSGGQLTPAGERWLRVQVAQSVRQPDQMVVVQVPGATSAVQRQRAAAIRHRLAAAGVPGSHIYVEAAPAGATRVSGL